MMAFGLCHEYDPSQVAVDVVVVVAVVVAVLVVHWNHHCLKKPHRHY